MGMDRNESAESSYVDPRKNIRKKENNTNYSYSAPQQPVKQQPKPAKKKLGKLSKEDLLAQLEILPTDDAKTIRQKQTALRMLNNAGPRILKGSIINFVMSVLFYIITVVFTSIFLVMRADYLPLYLKIPFMFIGIFYMVFGPYNAWIIKRIPTISKSQGIKIKIFAFSTLAMGILIFTQMVIYQILTIYLMH